MPGAIAHTIEQLFREGEVALCDVAERLLLGVASERGVAAEQNVRQHTHGPHVGLERDRVKFEDLRCWSKATQLLEASL